MGDFTSYMQIFIIFFILENDLSEIETLQNFIASFYLKMFFGETTYQKRKKSQDGLQSFTLIALFMW